MNDKMFTALMKKYDAEIEDALYRIDALNEHNLIIPEHTDILGEVDKKEAVDIDLPQLEKEMKNER